MPANIETDIFLYTFRFAALLRGGRGERGGGAEGWGDNIYCIMYFMTNQFRERCIFRHILIYRAHNLCVKKICEWLTTTKECADFAVVVFAFLRTACEPYIAKHIYIITKPASHKLLAHVPRTIYSLSKHWVGGGWAVVFRMVWNDLIYKISASCGKHQHRAPRKAFSRVNRWGCFF